MSTHLTVQRIYWTLRIAVAMCFIGHGAFGIITKAVWCNYFAVFGIGNELCYRLMPLVGGVDILLGLWMLFYPVRFVPLWLVAWGLLTALLRPLSGEPVAEFIERAGNYGAPFALLLLVGFAKKTSDWFRRIQLPAELTPEQLSRLYYCLRVLGFLLIAGHGWLNLILKQGLLNQYAALGFSNPEQTALIIGSLELVMALTILVKPIRELILLFFLWKIVSELFYPNYPVFEWIERGGSYGVLLSLWFLTERTLSFRLGTPAIYPQRS